ncbi:MAG: outer membrane beta-barrel family protein [Bacteroidota bacterium]
MRITHIFFFLIFALITSFPLTYAQNGQITVSGKVVENQRQQPIEFATVMLIDPATQKAIAGTTTDDKGRFRTLVGTSNFSVKVSFLGFEQLIIEKVEPEQGKVNLGTIALKEEVKTLDEVVIGGEKSVTEFKLDKRVFHVGKDLSSTGASALEVLNNVPSVNVNIEGVISLRGSSGVQVLINGKPSVLASEEGNALGTITADMIEKVEVITNPSAKYEAEGTSGIINIVLKKEEKKGINGSVTLNVGYPNNHSLGLSLNRRTEKFNLFTQVGVGHRTFPEVSETTNQNLETNTTIDSEGSSEKNETFYNLILGTDYHINKYNVLSLTGHFALEKESEFSDTDFGIVDDSGAQTSAWNRTESTRALNPKYQYELQYKKDFADHKEHHLLFSALGNFFGKDQSSEFSNVAISGKTPFGDQQSRNDFKEARYTFKLDYTKPFSEEWSMETGAQYVLSDVSNDYEVKEWINEAWVQDEGLTNLFQYSQKVLGAYGTGAYEGKKWGIKLGLRLENTDLSTLLAQTNESNQQNFSNLFPSGHSSYKFSDQFSLQAGYSRRIRRPRMWDLNPFFNVRNNFSIRTGNPELQPEFTDSYEINSIWLLEQISMNFGLFHRYTTDVVERISIFENDINTVKPFNIGTNRATGLEFNAKISPAKWLSINGDANYLYFNRQGSLNNQNFDFTGDQWSGKVTSKFKLPAKLDVEVSGHYQSRLKTVQGEVSGILFANLGVRKKIMNGKGVFNLSVRDVFASRIRETTTFQPGFYLYRRSLRGRFVTLGFSYGFGKGEAMEFSGQKRR